MYPVVNDKCGRNTVFEEIKYLKLMHLHINRKHKISYLSYCVLGHSTLHLRLGFSPLRVRYHVFYGFALLISEFLNHILPQPSPDKLFFVVVVFFNKHLFQDPNQESL